MPHISRRQALCAAAGSLVVARAQQSPGVADKKSMIVRSARPLDLEMPLSGFADYITPVEHFFVRTHVYAPKVDLANWRLKVQGSSGEALTLSMEDLRRLP